MGAEIQTGSPHRRSGGEAAAASVTPRWGFGKRQPRWSHAVWPSLSSAPDLLHWSQQPRHPRRQARAGLEAGRGLVCCLEARWKSRPRTPSGRRASQTSAARFDRSRSPCISTGCAPAGAVNPAKAPVAPSDHPTGLRFRHPMGFRQGLSDLLKYQGGPITCPQYLVPVKAFLTVCCGFASQGCHMLGAPPPAPEARMAGAPIDGGRSVRSSLAVSHPG
jgi:hypothetical protein